MGPSSQYAASLAPSVQYRSSDAEEYSAQEDWDSDYTQRGNPFTSGIGTEDTDSFRGRRFPSEFEDITSRPVLILQDKKKRPRPDTSSSGKAQEPASKKNGLLRNFGRKRPRKSKNTMDDDDDDDDENSDGGGSPPPPDDDNGLSKNSSQLPFACFYYKHAPGEYQCCRGFKTRDYRKLM